MKIALVGWALLVFEMMILKKICPSWRQRANTKRGQKFSPTIFKVKIFLTECSP